MIEIIPNIHPFLVHFSIALTIVCFILLNLGYGFSFLKLDRISKKCFDSAEMILYMLGIFIILTIFAGFYAFYTVIFNNMIAHKAMVLHRNIALIFTFSIFIFIIWAVILSRKKKFPSAFFMMGFIIPVCLALFTGYLGAELVYRHSIGVIKNVEVLQNHSNNHQH